MGLVTLYFLLKAQGAQLIGVSHYLGETPSDAN